MGEDNVNIKHHTNNHISEHQDCLQSTYGPDPCYCNKVLQNWWWSFDTYKPHPNFQVDLICGQFVPSCILSNIFHCLSLYAVLLSKFVNWNAKYRKVTSKSYFTTEIQHTHAYPQCNTFSPQGGWHNRNFNY